jgi:hypothetical protein
MWAPGLADENQRLLGESAVTGGLCEAMLVEERTMVEHPLVWQRIGAQEHRERVELVHRRHRPGAADRDDIRPGCA